MFTNSAGANNAGIFLIKHIERNPRFDRKQHWAKIWDIGQILGALCRNWGHWADFVDIGQKLGTLGRNWDIGQTFESFIFLIFKPFCISHVR